MPPPAAPASERKRKAPAKSKDMTAEEMLQQIFDGDKKEA